MIRPTYLGGTDHAQAATACVPGPRDRPETGLQGDVPLSARTAPNGFQGFWCGMNKVGQNVLFNRGTYGTTAIWGHCAYSSIRNPSDPTLSTTGVYVLDVSVPSNPTTGLLLRTPAMLQAYQGMRTQNGILLGSGQHKTASTRRSNRHTLRLGMPDCTRFKTIMADGSPMMARPSMACPSSAKTSSLITRIVTGNWRNMS
jgi:hypothetical protein